MKKYLLLLFPLIAALCGCSQHNCNPCALRKSHAQHDAAKLNAQLINPTVPLSYNDVIQLALCRNIDNIVRCEELEIQKETTTGARLGMLPSLTGDYSIEGRSNTLASFSRAISTGAVSLVQSTSTQNPARRWDFTLAWNILDFGMSYFQSRQEENKTEILYHHQLRTRQNLLLDVTKLYWKAVISKKGAEDARAMIQLLRQREQDIEKEISNRWISSLEGLDNKRHLIELEIRLAEFEQDLVGAKAELSGLIGLRIGPCFDLAPPPSYFYIPPNCMEQLIKIALMSRPELMAQDYDEKVQLDEVYIATLRMFPNAQFFSSYNRDQNLFLLHQYWYTAGLKASFDFLSLPKNYYGRLAAKDKVCLSKFTRLSLSVGVLTQVYIAYLDCLYLLEKFQIAHRLASTNAQLLDAASIAQYNGDYHLDNVIKLQAESMLANMASLGLYGELQVALERLGNAMGRPLAFSELATFYYKPEECPSLTPSTCTAESFLFDFNYHALCYNCFYPTQTCQCYPVEKQSNCQPINCPCNLSTSNETPLNELGVN